MKSEVFSCEIVFTVTALHLQEIASYLQVALQFLTAFEDLAAVLADSVSGAVFIKVVMKLENVHSFVLEDLWFGFFQSLGLARFEVFDLILLIIDQGRLNLVILCFYDTFLAVTSTVSIGIFIRCIKILLGFNWTGVLLLHLLHHFDHHGIGHLDEL